MLQCPPEKSSTQPAALAAGHGAHSRCRGGVEQPAGGPITTPIDDVSISTGQVIFLLIFRPAFRPLY